ncbi:transcription factor HES-4 isoform X1 [Tursiops truncatus]|uniref:transcription factor HES-4 isoform X1 n=1 Tax=Tursiops truncatus TaxID=9739 RepID=UPI003CCF5F03
MTSSCLTDDVTPPALWHHVHWSRDATLPVYDLGRPACLLPSGWCSTSTVSRASCRCCSRRGSDSQAARRPEGPAGSAESRGVRAEARRLLGGASPGSPREFSFQISRGPSSPGSQAAGSARSVPEPGTRGRGAREAVRPARPRPRAARGRTMPADTPGKLRASPRAGAPAGARRTPDQPRSAAEHRKVGTRPDAVGRSGGERGADARGTQPLPAPQSSKPVMEKRRRARINESLAQLQSLLLDALRKEVSRGREGEIGEPGIPALLGCQPPTPAPPPELPPLEAGEGGHPGADREAPAEPAARAGDSRPPRRPGSPGQVPRRLPRVSGRGESLPGWLRGRPGRRAVPSARPSGDLPGPAGALAPPASTGPRRRSSGARGLRGPLAAASLRRPLPLAALQGGLGAALPAGPDGGAPRRPRSRGSGPGRTLEAVAAVRSRPQNPLRLCQKIFISRGRVGSFVLSSS